MHTLKDFNTFEKNLTVNESEVVNETRGNALASSISELKETILSVRGGSKSITDENVGDMMSAVSEMEEKLKKILKGKGLVGW